MRRFPKTNIFQYKFADEKDIKDLEAKLKQHQRDAARRENTLVHRLTTKEQELQDYIVSLLIGHLQIFF